MADPVGPLRPRGTALALVLGLVACLPAAAIAGVPARTGGAVVPSASTTGTGQHLPVVHHLSDGTRIACTRASECMVLEAAHAEATAALDPVLPSPLYFSAVTLLAPTQSGQLAVVGARSGAVPAATTLLVGEDLVSRGLAAPADRGRVWIVVNPTVVAAGTETTAQVLVHELVHVRTRAADLAGPLWVEEGFAVAVADRATGSRPRSAATMAPTWPSDDWTPTTVGDYAAAGTVVHALADRVGWQAVARWYAATTIGTPSAEAARLVVGPSTGSDRGNG